MRWKLKNSNGETAAAVVVAQIADDVAISKRTDDDEVIEISLDDVELRALVVVLSAVVSVRDRLALEAKGAAPAPAPVTKGPAR